MTVKLNQTGVDAINSHIRNSDPYLVLTGTLEAGGAPEPASWVVMLSGFGFVGYQLRRRVLRAG